MIGFLEDFVEEKNDYHTPLLTYTSFLPKAPMFQTLIFYYALFMSAFLLGLLASVRENPSAVQVLVPYIIVNTFLLILVST